MRLPPPVGHETTLTRLASALERDALHHALLFEGPAGVGKHEAALWLARAAVCEDGPGLRPCGRCPTCERVQAGVHPDVITLAPDPDKATPVIPVDDVRDLIRKLGFHRYGARARFVVIDPIDTMAPAASNALLKTLEEPPSGTYFVLVATTARTLLPTIVSRCQRIRFGPLDEARLTELLVEKGVDDAAELARVAQGSLGVALALADGGLDARRTLREELLGVLEAGVGPCLAAAQDLGTGGRAVWSPKVAGVLDLLEELLRDVVAVAAGPGRTLVHETERARLELWAQRLWPSGVERCRVSLREAHAALAVNTQPTAVLDALFARFATELGRG